MNTPILPLDWDRAPLEAFARFVVSPAFLATGKPRHHQAEPRLVKAPSARVYISMFSRFMTWLNSIDATQRMSLPAISTARLREFLAITDEETGRPRLASNIAYRYLRLIDRVLSHLGREPNPARELLQELRARSHDNTVAAAAQGGATIAPADCSMVALTSTQLRQFLAALPDPQSGSGAGKKRPYAPWKRERDRALLCMIAGAGLKPAEAIGMMVDEFNATPLLGGEHDGYFLLNLKPAGKHPTSFGHVAYLDPELAPDILAWLRRRRLLGIEGELMFPSTRAGKLLSQATVYLLTKKTFERAGIAVMRSGGRTLRNSYAVREIQRAVDKHELKDMLGLALENSTQLYFDAARRIDHTSPATPAFTSPLPAASQSTAQGKPAELPDLQVIKTSR